MFIDTHAHLLKKYYSEINQVILEAKQFGIKTIFNISFDLASSKEVIELNKQFSNLYPVVGIHPIDTKQISYESIDQLDALIAKNRKVIVAIGEIGLDFHYPDYDEKEQIEFFIAQINLAKKYNLPIVVHTRDSLEKTWKIIQQFPNQKFLLHSWAGDSQLTKKILSVRKNIYFSYNGILTFKNAHIQKEVIKLIPFNRLLFETDCPYLTPVPLRGKKNYPQYVKYVYEYSADLLKIELKNLVSLITKNTTDFFQVNLINE